MLDNQQVQNEVVTLSLTMCMLYERTYLVTRRAVTCINCITSIQLSDGAVKYGDAGGVRTICGRCMA